MESDQIQRLIYYKERKNDYSRPYYANTHTITNFPTDMTNFPYTRFFRGVAWSPSPIIIDREPGVSKPLYYKNYNPQEGLVTTPAPYFFQYAPSTVVPPQNISERENKYRYRMSSGCVPVSI